MTSGDGGRLGGLGDGGRRGLNARSPDQRPLAALLAGENCLCVPPGGDIGLPGDRLLLVPARAATAV